MRLVVLSLAIGTSLSAGVLAEEQRVVGLGELPPIGADYKARINSWARRFFVDPRAVSESAISDPALIRDGTGRLLWLVCLEATNTAQSARPNGPVRYAFGFAPKFFSAPQERRGSTLVGADCDNPALQWKPFAEYGRTPPKRRKVSRKR